MNGTVWDMLPAKTLAAVVVMALVVVATSASGPATAQQTAPEADNTVTHITVRSTGDAQWRIQIRTRLDTQDRLEEFQAFQDEFRRNTSQYLGPFSDRIRAVVARAANATGRRMTATNFSASTSIQEVPRRWGVVTFEYTWQGFAEQRNDTLVVGDVFQGGFFLAANDSLKIATPDGYDVTTVDPAPDERGAEVLTWFGREDFSDGRPHVVFGAEEPTDGVPTTAPGTSPTPVDADRQAPGHDEVPWLLIGGALLVGLIAVGTYTLWRRGRVPGASPLASPQTIPAVEEEPAEQSAVDGDVLTDAEQVARLLERHGGRMKQAAIADELGWSASKVSRVVSGMVDDDTVTKLQLGRENLVEFNERE